ncbi:unnamed protein product [Mytilus coruscus]|uniref:Peptidase aspartic putative domain-containing protein n=1 Tax=Mytilus coruscus TaxID=42192 RepID=A0A6J8BR11_MYTCO|nr:unnamed protein product [Mytilus coruscus]
MERDRASCDKLYNGAVTQVKLIKNADARSVSTTSSQRSKTKAKLEAIQAKVRLAGVAKIWERLDKRLGTHEMVEAAIKERLSSLPTVIECNSIANDVSEIPTPEVAKLHLHLNSIADKISPLLPSGKIQLLIGRDLINAHHVQEQITGPKGTPFAQKLSLGWVIVGEVCIGIDGRTTVFDPYNSKQSVCEQPIEHSFGNSLFVKTQ